MNQLIWKIRELVSRVLPLALIAGLIYGGWTLHKKGTFRHGVGPAVSSVLGKIPYFGSRFRHHLWNQNSVAASGGSKKFSRAHSRKGKAHHGRRRGRRH